MTRDSAVRRGEVERRESLSSLSSWSEVPRTGGGGRLVMQHGRGGAKDHQQ